MAKSVQQQFTNRAVYRAPKKNFQSKCFRIVELQSSNNNNNNKNLSTSVGTTVRLSSSASLMSNEKSAPVVVNNQQIAGTRKPALTLSCLIFMALTESPNECLPVREIYEWIEAHFAYYRTCSNTGWKSSIRHNLSFSKCFSKMNRAELVVQTRKNGGGALKSKHGSSGGGGTYWKVNPECQSFLIHSLKKSQYWVQNSASYPKLSQLVREYDMLQANLDTVVWHHNHQRSTLISTTHQLR